MNEREKYIQRKREEYIQRKREKYIHRKRKKENNAILNYIVFMLVQSNNGCVSFYLYDSLDYDESNISCYYLSIIWLSNIKLLIIILI